MTRLPNNLEEARAWTKLKGTHERERRYIAKAYLLGYRDKPPGTALLIPQKLHDDAWRLGRKCKQYEREAKAATRGDLPTEAYYRQRGQHMLRVRVSDETLTQLGEIADSLPGKPTRAAAVMHAVSVAHGSLKVAR